MQQRVSRRCCQVPLVNTLAAHLHELGTHGYMNVQKLAAAVDTLRNVSFSAFHCEKQHASVALVKKFHPEVTTFVLCMRAFAHGLRELVPGVSDEERALARLREDLQKALRLCPSDVGARQIYLRGVMMKREEADEKRARTRG
eukprot:680198-Amphidinium_carterae.1